MLSNVCPYCGEPMQAVIQITTPYGTIDAPPQGQMQTCNSCAVIICDYTGFKDTLQTAIQAFGGCAFPRFCMN